MLQTPKVIVIKGPPKGRLPIPSLIYRAQTYDGDHPGAEPTWQCEHEHDGPLDAYNCAKSRLQQNHKAEPAT